jgi:DNA polymerase III alpha subunit
VIHLRIRTEFSFRRAYGKLADVTLLLQTQQVTAAALTDGGTWGHVKWAKACKTAGIKPIFGVELAVVPNPAERERQTGPSVVFLAANDAGLRELYALVSLANGPENFYYVPRISYGDLNHASSNMYALIGPGADLDWVSPRLTTYLALSPTNAGWNRKANKDARFGKVVVCDNHYPLPEDQAAYEILAALNKVQRTTPMTILDEDALRLAVPEADDEAWLNVARIAEDCNAHLPRAENIRINSPQTLYALCLEGATAKHWPMDVRGCEGPDGGQSSRIELLDRTYQARLDRELDLIYEKKFEDYFYLVGDLVRWAKGRMLVGPARGSSAGSLVCYLLGITDVDPLVHGLMFERFIDVTRADLPDIDIDFQDDRRDLVIEYLRETYGPERVGRIGTVMQLKAKSCLGDVARELEIPAWEIRDVQDAVIERSTGDARAQFAVEDALQTLDVGKALVAKYPGLLIAAKLEGHAQHTGKHAAGVVVTQTPILHYCSQDNSGASQIDKKDAEVLNLLKIDALGLRTLSILQDCLDSIGQTRQWLVDYPLDDVSAFEVLNAERYAGIFQFEGAAMQSLTRQMKVRSFYDLQVIGALARPGPLHCGAATDFIVRRVGNASVTHMHPSVEPITRETYGIVIYQEQVMAIAREVGKLSWSDVTELRKAMSKSLGDEFFNRYWERFAAGAAEHGISMTDADKIWKRMCTFGSWAFNKSHSVSYGIISYWCCLLKAHYPLEFAAACLRNERNEDQGIRVLRDLVKEGYAYRPIDPEANELSWHVRDGVLTGGLTNIKGIGAAKAAEIIRRRSEGVALTPGQRKLLFDAKTPYDNLFEAAKRFGEIYANPKAFGVMSGPISTVEKISDAGDYVIIAKLKEKNLRDMNEYHSLQKRNNRFIKRNPLFLNLQLEDDTGVITSTVSRYNYAAWGKPLIESAKVGDWFLWKGYLRDDGWRIFNITQWRVLEGDDHPLHLKKPESAS